MKASKFSDAQKSFILKQAVDGVPVADICRKAGISHCEGNSPNPISNWPAAGSEALARAVLLMPSTFFGGYTTAVQEISETRIVIFGPLAARQEIVRIR